VRILRIVFACGATLVLAAACSSARPEAAHVRAASRAPLEPSTTTSPRRESLDRRAAECVRSDSLVPCDGPPPTAPPCPSAPTEPSFTGRYCGPPPGPGNGDGPSGVCTGGETAPPCGPGMIPGRLYAYSLPGSCDGRVIIDGKVWRSELPPDHTVPALYGWVRVSADDDHAGWFGPQGALGIDPDPGQPIPVCSQ